MIDLFFSIVHDIETSTKKDIKLSLSVENAINPDLSKKVQEVIFLGIYSRVDHLAVTFSNSPVARTAF